MDLKIVLAAGVAAALVFALPAKPWLRAVVAFGAVLLVLALFPSNTNRASFTLTATTGVLLALGVVAITTPRGRAALAMFVPFLAVFGILWVAVWPHTAASTAGALNLLAVVAAWGAGALLAPSVGEDSPARRSIALLIAAVVVVQLAICVLQAAGFDIFTPTGRTLDLEGGRSTGTFGHPSVIGKTWLLLLVIVLPLSRSADTVTRRAATVSMLGMLAAVGLSASRANFIALVAALLLWSLLSPSTGSLMRRWALPALVGVVGLFFIGTILDRFDRDPAGGARDHFMTVALDQLARDPVFGLGPSRYLEVLSAVDSLTAAGWPVHNAFVLEAVELGLVAGALLFAPLAWVAVRAVAQLRAGGVAGDTGRAVIAVLPGLIVVGVTGWGLVAPFTHLLWFFVFGLASALVARQRVTPAVMRPRDALAGIR